MPDLAGKVVVITGAAQGIGAEYASHLGELGARVVVADIDGDGARETAQKLVADGIAASSQPVDITSEESANALVSAVVDREERIDVLVNNAAIYRGLHMVADVADTDVDYWRTVLDVNLTGTFVMSKAVIPQMRRQQSGKIINQASTAAYIAAPQSLHYCAAKAGVITVTKGLAQALGADGITVNAIAPGMTTSEATNEMFDGEHQTGFAQMTALKRTASPADMAPVVAFLASTDSDYITGQTIVVDGGMIFLG